MAIRNPYYDDREDEYAPMRRNAIVDQLASEPIDRNRPRPSTDPIEFAPDPNAFQPHARPRTPTRTPQQTREMLSGPGGRTQAVDEPDYSNAFTGTPDATREDLYTPSVAEAATGAQRRAESSNRQRGYSLLDAYDDPYERRMEGPGGVLSNAAKYAQTGAGIGSAFAGVGAIPGAIIGGIGGAIGGAFSKNAKSAMTDFSIEDARQIISQAYKDAFGRDMTPQELDEAIRGQGWEPGDKWFGEAPLAYVLDQFANNAAAERAARGPETPAAAPGAAAASPTGTGGGLPFSGFDFNRAQDPSKSAKDAFAAAAQQAPPMTDTSKAGAEAWFREHIAPKMEAAGYRIYDLQGDKAWVGSREDPEGRTPVDWLINAGGSNPQIGWQPESGGGAGGGSGDMQGAYQNLLSMVGPDASREDMEAAITAAFKDVPGFQGAYKESVNINGQWYDLVTGYGGPGASWGGLTPKNDHGGGGGGVVGAGALAGAGVNLAPGVSLAPVLGNSNVIQEIMAEIQRIQRGQPPRAAIIGQLGVS